ncbi:50S ribosomal protein L9 [bacterium (Candidatus Howlettbacteria) CG_4_10_14_0_8_um_filter_40_9]|nr:MAG: 50S ribosomal protein L9 [bacterium (Candidatus Howlettbacteria) CG_4_10_14_0_8_um_filter_40_9]
MKVIFTQNIENHVVGDIKDVPDGYARNFLVPRGIAIPATPSEIQNIEKRIEKLKKDEGEKVKKLEETALRLGKINIEISAEVGPKDDEGIQKLFGSITNAQVEEELTKKGFEIDKKDIDFEPIKKPGEYEITVKLGHGVESKVPLKVTAKKEK